jgi:uncharacterized protein YndB with AHSA1/START domain
MKAYGDLTANDTIRFERMLPGPIEHVWAHLVEPDKRRLWLANGPMTLIPGGEMTLRFRNAELSRDDDRAPEPYRAQENSGEVHGRILCANRRTGWHSPGATIRHDPGMRRRKSRSH